MAGKRPLQSPWSVFERLAGDVAAAVVAAAVVVAAVVVAAVADGAAGRQRPCKTGLEWVELQQQLRPIQREPQRL